MYNLEQLFNKPELVSALQSGALGIVIGSIFAIFGLKPPSPDNLAGILGIIGIFLGWAIAAQFFK